MQCDWVVCKSMKLWVNHSWTIFWGKKIIGSVLEKENVSPSLGKCDHGKMI